MLNAGTSATAVSWHFGCTRKTIERLRRQFRVTRNVAGSGRPRVTTAANDRYIVLQQLRNRRLTAAATGIQYSIHAQAVRNRLRQNVNLFVRTDRISVKFPPDVIERKGGIGAAVTCFSDVLIEI